MLRVEAVLKFLHQQPFELCKLYTPEMEVQINVARDDGEPIQGVYAGLRWQGYTDGLQVWKHFRIPWNAAVDPKYEDRELKFALDQHVEAIGMTGWDYINKKSRWVAFDFDSLLTHKEGLTKDELDDIIRKLSGCDFTTIYSSTSGNGLHVYVFIQDDTAVLTHTEHAAVARAILSQLSALTGLDFQAKVDTLGGNMWVWHRRATVEKSYKLIKRGLPLLSIPPNWRDFLNIVTKSNVQQTRVTESSDKDELVAARRRCTLDQEHLRLLDWFEKANTLWWFDDSRQMLVCHTFDLKRAHQELKLRGFFDTVATGKDKGHDQNCFCFPSFDGSWCVRRHSKNCKEHPSWYTDNKGWTTCFFNRRPNLRVAASLSQGTEAEKGYVFRTLALAVNTLLLMGIDCEMPAGMQNRPAGICETKDGRIKIFYESNEYDEQALGWIQGKGQWIRYFFRPRIVDEVELPDHILRHVTSHDAEYGWFLLSDTTWIEQSRVNIISSLVASSYRRPDIDALLGLCVLNAWKLVNKPFQPEYPGNREWNKETAQLRFIPKRGKHPTWDLILEHCGEGLNDSLRNSEFAKSTGILNGVLYLLAWTSSIIQYPSDPTPYLFFTGPQNCGKSIFHECLSLLFTRGYIRADQALTSSSGFNGELAPAIICVVEETNLSKRGPALDRIKDWVTGKTLSIHPKNKTPYIIPNCTHWIQCANSPEYCPVFPGDTRITLVRLNHLKQEIPKHVIMKQCEDEAPAFLYTLLNFELPDQLGRLRIPVVETEEKRTEMAYNRSPLEIFIEEFIVEAPGYKILFSEFYNKFQLWLDPSERPNWSNRRVSKEIPFLKGKAGSDGQLYLGNVSFEIVTRIGKPLVKAGDRLVFA